MTFVKGASGNPGGRPRGRVSVVNLLLRKLTEKLPDGKQRNVDAIADQLIFLARGGDLDAIKVVLDRVDGKVVERLEHSGPGGEALKIAYINDWRSTEPD